MSDQDSLHPLILVSKPKDRVLNNNQKLLMVVGREPNSSQKYGDHIGEFWLDEPGVGHFWKVTHTILGDLIGYDQGQDLKKKVIENNFSPITFTNFSPKPLESTEDDVPAKRNQIDDEQIRNHIQSIFEKDLIHRVDLFILAVGDREELQVNEKTFRRNAETHGIDVVKTPFMDARLKNEILDSLESEKENIRKIIGEGF